MSYRRVNRVLRLLNVDTIMEMGAFISDLHRDIEQLHGEHFNDWHTSDTFTVYRGQRLCKARFEGIKNTKVALLFSDTFLSISKDREVAVAFVESNQTNIEFLVLYAMTFDSSKPTTPFACIKGVSGFNKEDELLSSMHTIFRIGDIRQSAENQRFVEVDLTLTSNNHTYLRLLTECIRAEIDPESKEWNRLDKLLLKIGRFDIAHQAYEASLDQTT